MEKENITKAILFIALFIISALFFNASRILAWFLGVGKPAHPHWKLYGIIAGIIWALILILANTIL